MKSDLLCSKLSHTNRDHIQAFGIQGVPGGM